MSIYYVEENEFDAGVRPNKNMTFVSREDADSTPKYPFPKDLEKYGERILVDSHNEDSTSDMVATILKKEYIDKRTQVIVLFGSSGAGKTYSLNKILLDDSIFDNSDSISKIFITSYEMYFEDDEIKLSSSYGISHGKDKNNFVVDMENFRNFFKGERINDLKMFESMAEYKTFLSIHHNFPRSRTKSIKETPNNKNSSRSHAIVSLCYCEKGVNIQDPTKWEQKIFIDCIGMEDIMPGLKLRGKTITDISVLIGNKELAKSLEYDDKIEGPKNKALTVEASVLLSEINSMVTDTSSRAVLRFPIVSPDNFKSLGDLGFFLLVSGEVNLKLVLFLHNNVKSNSAIIRKRDFNLFKYLVILNTNRNKLFDFYNEWFNNLEFKTSEERAAISKMKKYVLSFL